jgi:hypothetical protein
MPPMDCPRPLFSRPGTRPARLVFSGWLPVFDFWAEKNCETRAFRYSRGWVLLAAGILFGARYSRFPQLWLGAMLAALVFPHSVGATATLLTEGPSLLFAVLGVLARTEFAIWPAVTPGSVFLGMFGGFSMELAVTCRQYYLALLPAAVLFGFLPFELKTSSPKALATQSRSATDTSPSYPCNSLRIPHPTRKKSPGKALHSRKSSQAKASYC